MRIGKTLQRWLCVESSPPIDRLVLASVNRAFEALPARRRIEQAIELLPECYVLTSSFGAQAAVMLHLVNDVLPGIPVVLIDTGYLFPETYSFIDELTDRLTQSQGVSVRFVPRLAGTTLRETLGSR